MKTCSINGCEKPVFARGWCNTHWRRWRKHGDPMAVGPPRHKTGGPCAVENCPKIARQRGWCNAHYGRWLRHGDPLGGRTFRTHKPGATCSVEGCPDLTVNKGYCAPHYYRSRVHGDPLAGRVIRGSIPFCTVNACKRKYYCNGRCQHHYAQLREAMRRSNGPWEDIDLPVLHERDGGICYLCGGQVPPHFDNRSPDGWSVDHVLPVSRGGTHTWDNVRLTHHGCNSGKKDRLLVGLAGGA